MNVVERVNKAKQLLAEVKSPKRDELVEKSTTILSTKNRLHEEILTAADDKNKNEKQEEMELHITEAKHLIKEYEEEKSINQSILQDANEILKDITEKAAVYMGNKEEKKIILLSENINKLNAKLQSTPSWQLTASKSMIKSIDDLQSASSKFTSMLLNFVASENEKFKIEIIIRSPEFGNVWDLCQAAIRKMRSEM